MTMPALAAAIGLAFALPALASADLNLTTEAADTESGAVGGLAVVGGTAKVEKSRAKIWVFCNGPSSCEGTVKLTVKGVLVEKGGKTKKQTVTAGRASFSLAPENSLPLSIKLSGASKRLLTNGKHLRGRVAGAGIHPHSVRLKRA